MLNFLLLNLVSKKNWQYTVHVDLFLDGCMLPLERNNYGKQYVKGTSAIG